jgi:diadenosine tetraphosphatase ApaH/serine/threonine PP2A family protein phosphatase
MFDYLTISVVIDDRIFCVHGGLSPSIHSIDQIKVVDRFREIPHEGPMADLVWSDPDAEKEDFAISPRYVFGRFIFGHDLFYLIGPRRTFQGCRVHFWISGRTEIPGNQFHGTHSACPSAMHGGV